MSSAIVRDRLMEKLGQNGFRTSPTRRNSDSEQSLPYERRLALLGVLFSLVVISVKIFYEHCKYYIASL